MQKLLIKNAKALLFKHDDVVIEPKDILVENGKINKIEDCINDESAYLINAANCVVMPGLINTHSHIAIRLVTQKNMAYREKTNKG